jgi:phage shock protein A
MGLFQRASLIISANINDLLDRVEQPETMLRHGLRELEVSIETVSAAVARSIAAQRLLARERDDYRAQAEAWQAHARAGVAAGNDDLARKAIGRKLELTRVLASLEPQLAEAESANQALRRQLETLRSKHAQAKRRLSTVAARKAVADAQQSLRSAGGAVACRTRAVDAVDGLLDKLDWVEADALARTELATETSNELAQSMEEESLNAETEAELADIKASVNATPN